MLLDVMKQCDKEIVVVVKERSCIIIDTSVPREIRISEMEKS